MVHNYLGSIANYGRSDIPVAFFSYIAGGFGKNIDSQIQAIYDATNIPGSAMSVSNLIKMVEINQERKFTHKEIRTIFGLNRQILISDIG